MPDLSNGGVLFFAGGVGLKAGLGGIVSEAIDLFSESCLSHVAIALPDSVARGGWMAESTIWAGVSGPQFNFIAPRFQEDYLAKGGRGWLRRFAPGFEPNWPALLAQATLLDGQRIAGKLHYSVKRLFEDACFRLGSLAYLPPELLIERLGETDKGLVCSEEAAMLLEAGGLREKCEAAGISWLLRSKPTPGCAVGCTPVDCWMLGDAGVMLPGESL